MSLFDELLPLRIAADIAFRDKSVKVSSLRKERDRGRLVTYMVAGKEFTTLKNIEEMIKKCVVTPKGRGFGSALNEGMQPDQSPTNANGSSATDLALSEQALAQRIESWQKSGFKHISRKNISPHVILETP